MISKLIEFSRYKNYKNECERIRGKQNDEIKFSQSEF
jgi:hypothetical protein